MKILHLSSERNWRGGEQQIAYLIEESLKEGIEIIVLCREGSSFHQYCIKQNISFITAAFRNSLDFPTALQVKRLCTSEDISFIHTHSGKSHGLAYLAARLGNKTDIIAHRRVDFPIKNNLSRKKYDHPRVKKVICVSNKIKTILKDSMRHPDKCIAIHSGVDTNKFKNERTKYFHQRYNLPKDSLLIGNTSALSTQKDYISFIDTAALLKKTHPQLRFLIIGEGDQKENLEKHIKSKDLEEYIFLTGFITKVSQYLQELDLFLMTSITEGLGTSIIDAFASKIPVVATNTGGIPELVINNHTGILCECKDIEALANGIKILLQDKEKKELLVNNAHVHLRGFTKESMAEGVIAVYRACI